jgi:hypothetical protein
MANQYVLVNPYINGEFKNKILANNSNEAAQTFYNELSGTFNNAVPEFYFTIQKGEKGKYYHFKSVEKRVKNNVKYSIEPYTVKNSDVTKFENKLNVFKNKISQNGGKKHKKQNKKNNHDSSESDDSESDSSSESTVRKYGYTNVWPATYWWYDPFVYKLDTFYIPTFYAWYTPVVEICYNC